MFSLALILLAPILAGRAASVTPAVGGKAQWKLPTGQCLAVQLRPLLAAAADEARVRPSRDSDADLETHRVPRGPFFSAARTLDIELSSRLRRDVRSQSRLEFRVYTPSGHLYQTLRAQSAWSRPRASDGRLVRAERVGGAALPVAGTDVVNHSLYGRWSVEPHLDGSPRPCGPVSRFWITP